MLRLIDRTAPKHAPRKFATFVTFIVSALWHGLFPGYFVFFIAAAFLEMQAKSFHKIKAVVAVRRYLPTKAETVILWLWMNYTVPYFGMAFIFLGSERYNRMYEGLYWSGHIIMPIVTVIGFVLPKQKSERAIDKQKLS